ARCTFDPPIDRTLESIIWGARAVSVSHDFFPLLGVSPFLGRLFVSDDYRASPKPVLISHDLWLTRFGGRADLLGTLIDIPGSIDGRRWHLVGVLPKGFAFPRGSNIWIAASADGANSV